MIKKLLYVASFVVFIVGGVATFVFYTTTGQDVLMKRAATTLFSQRVNLIDGMRVTVCGSASPLGNDTGRAQACIAVLTPEHFFLFDVGAGSQVRIAQARLPLARINGVFLTHFHSDHIAALPDVNLASWIQGRSLPLQVFGPAGVGNVVAGFNAAYRLDRDYRTAHHGSGLLAPERGPMEANTIAPGSTVWQDDTLTITAFIVDHVPIEPAVGYRVDYGGRSVVISGDTNVTDGLFLAASNADLLLHDALSRPLLDPMIEAAAASGTPRLSTIMSDVIDYHADATLLPARTRAAGIKQLVLYHMVPIPSNALAKKIFVRDLPDNIIMAEDLQSFYLPRNSTEIIIHHP